MKRRAFLGGAGAALTALPAAPALARTRRELTMISVWPERLPGAGAKRIAERITAASDGALTVTVVPSGSLVPPFETFDAVAAGKADLYYGAEFFWHFKSPAFSLFSGLPFGLTATELNAWIRHGGGQKHWDALSARFNLKPFLAGNLGGSQIRLSRHHGCNGTRKSAALRAVVRNAQ